MRIRWSGSWAGWGAGWAEYVVQVPAASLNALMYSTATLIGMLFVIR